MGRLSAHNQYVIDEAYVFRKKISLLFYFLALYRLLNGMFLSVIVKEHTVNDK